MDTHNKRYDAYCAVVKLIKQEGECSSRQEVQFEGPCGANNACLCLKNVRWGVMPGDTCARV